MSFYDLAFLEYLNSYYISAPKLRSHYSRYTQKCGVRIHVTLDDIIKESEDEMEHSHMPDPTEDKINKVKQESLQRYQVSYVSVFQGFCFGCKIAILFVKMKLTI